MYLNCCLDLYYEFVAPTLGNNFLAETWQNGRGSFGSSCGKYNVWNINGIQLPNQKAFTINQDHSKWAISENEKLGKWVCIGDINRQVSHFYCCINCSFILMSKPRIDESILY